MTIAFQMFVDLPQGWERIVDPVYGVYYIEYVSSSDITLYIN